MTDQKETKKEEPMPFDLGKFFSFTESYLTIINKRLTQLEELVVAIANDANVKHEYLDILNKNKITREMLSPKQTAPQPPKEDETKLLVNSETKEFTPEEIQEEWIKSEKIKAQLTSSASKDDEVKLPSGKDLIDQWYSQRPSTLPLRPKTPFNPPPSRSQSESDTDAL